jgi:lipoate-protein ligase B
MVQSPNQDSRARVDARDDSSSPLTTRVRDACTLHGLACELAMHMVELHLEPAELEEVICELVELVNNYKVETGDSEADHEDGPA